MTWSLRFYLAFFSIVVGCALVMAQQTGRQRPGGREVIALELVAVGDVDPALLEDIARETGRTYGLPCRVAASALSLPEGACDVERRQYLSATLLEELRLRPAPATVCRLGVTEADLFMPDLNFVFGEADLPGPVAVMSLARLRPRAPGREADPDRLLDRAVKVAVHELGHAMGLRHCAAETCVMRFANSARELDLLSRLMCPDCLRQLG